MSSISLKQPSIFSLLFRRTADEPDLADPLLEDLDDLEMAGIRCPLCKWRPRRNDRWCCWKCAFPENFRGGCGTEWNTFETRGVCPTCVHQWIWTSCFGCLMWSKHEDWYGET